MKYSLLRHCSIKFFFYNDSLFPSLKTLIKNKGSDFNELLMEDDDIFTKGAAPPKVSLGFTFADQLCLAEALLRF